MRIGLDIDNVISDFDSEILKEFLFEDKNKRNSGIIDNNAKHIIKEMFDWTEDEVQEFMNNNMERIAKKLSLRRSAKKYMDKLLLEGNELYLISHRAYPHYNNPLEVTKQWLYDNKVNYTKLILSNTTDKSPECKENGIEVFIDDVVSNCMRLEEAGIKCYLMKTKYNRKQKKIKNIVKSWEDLYKKVSELKMKKENIILDTDMENEIDDQFALTYLIKSIDKFNLEAVTIAPFSKSGYANTKTIEEGTEKSYQTTLKIMDMLNFPYKEKVYKGALKYMKDSEEANDAVNKIIEIAHKNDYTTVLAIGAITNVALAIKKDSKIIDKIKVIWLGGNSFLTDDNNEFNFRQDIKAVQTVFNSKVELVVVPCRNIASNLNTTIYELRHYIEDKGDIGKYLCDIFIKCKKAFTKSPIDEIGSSKTLWDLSVIAYVTNKEWFKEKKVSSPIILENGLYELTTDRHEVTFVNDLFRNKIYQDFFIKMGCESNEIK